MFALQDHTHLTTARVDWTLARCADDDVVAEAGVATMTDLFFSDEIPAIRAAKAICATCPVQQLCLEHALTNRERDGVWGGLTEKERRRIIRQRRKTA